VGETVGSKTAPPPPLLQMRTLQWFFLLGNPFSPNFAIKEEYSAEIPPFAEENLLAEFSRKTCFLRKIWSIVLTLSRLFATRTYYTKRK
jgi:hypothetical protein